MAASVQLFLTRVAFLFLSGFYCSISALAILLPPAQRTPRPASAEPSQLAPAESLLEQGRLPDAKTSVVDFLRLHASSIEGYNLLGIICSTERDYDGALDAFQHALKLNPNSPKTHTNLGNLYASASKLDLAEKEFRRALALAPSDPEANYNLGLLLMSEGKPSVAIPLLQRVRPARIEAQMNLVRAYLRAHRTAEGLRLATQLSATGSSEVQRQFTLGLLLAEEKQYRAAELELEKADALKPETFEILYSLGQSSLRDHEYAKADLVLNRALKINPDSIDTLYLLSEVRAEQARPLDALELLVRAHKLAPENADVIFLMARVSMTQNYFEDAIPLLESGIKIAPEHPDLHAALGESYFMAGKTEEAIAEFQKLIDLDPSARSYAFMGLSYRHLGRFDEARKYFQEGLKHDPHSTSCLFNLGFIEERQGNYARAGELFQQSLRNEPDFAEALLELANLRIKDKKFDEAVELLRRFVRVSLDPADGYYKLAMAERSLHQTAAAQRDLSVFQTLSKNAATGPYPYQHLFDYLDNRSTLSAQQRAQLDVSQLREQIQKHPGQTQDFYLLAETYLKLGKPDDARVTIAQLDQTTAADYRMQAGIGVLLAHYRLYDDAIAHFQTALGANPDSDDVKFDLANAYFRRGKYRDALDTAQKVSPAGRRDDAFLSLTGDIEAHLGETGKAIEVFRDAISRNPDNDQYYLSLTLIQLRQSDLSGAEQTLETGLKRIPGSGKIQWGLGLVAALHGDTARAGKQLELAVELLPEWSGSYSTLGVFYYQTGQVQKAREVLERFKGSNAGGLDVGRIEEALSRAPANASAAGAPLSVDARQQLLQFALIIADRSL